MVVELFGGMFYGYKFYFKIWLENSDVVWVNKRYDL